MMMSYLAFMCGTVAAKKLLAKRSLMPNHNGMTTQDPCLTHAHAQWLAPLQRGEACYDAGELHAALAPLAEAIRISAAFHPLFHFLESGLNTELAQLYLSQDEWDKAETAFKRAEFLHHDNEVAIAGLQLAKAQQKAELPTYRTISLSRPLKPEVTEQGIYALRKRAKETGSAALYAEAIEACEAAHLHYHQLAAQPWLVRARVFAAQGEEALARNDIRHGMDLDRKNADLLQLSMQLAA